MLFGPKNEVVYGVGASARVKSRLEVLADIWARQTGRPVVVAGANGRSARPAAPQ